MRLLYHLTLEVAGDVGDVYPASVALPNELREAYLSLLLHLLDKLEQAAVVGLRAADDVGGAAEDVVAVLDAAHQLVELLAAIARGY